MKFQAIRWRLFFGEAREYIDDKRGRVEIYFDARDLWIGIFVDPEHRAIYLCPLPTLVIRISLWPEWS